jgi:hypothetical protein
LVIYILTNLANELHARGIEDQQDAARRGEASLADVLPMRGWG